MRFARVRSGLEESTHDVSVVAVDQFGSVLYRSGAIETPVYYRSAIKPLQALAGIRLGLQLPPEHLAVSCATHGGFPVHLAIVDQILSDHDLTREALRCTPGRPYTRRARQLQAERGNFAKERRFHNCSGKHAGWLAACAVAGLPRDSYLEPSHPIQRAIVDIVTDATGIDPAPIGIDGCGAPTLSGTIIGLATAFSRLTTDSEYAPIAEAMTRFGALVADNTRPDGRLAANWGGPSKIGAEGLFAMSREGTAIAAKSHEGNQSIAVSAALVAASTLGMMNSGAAEWLEDVSNPPVFGGGRIVGRMRLVSP
ncbi:MAG: asparaginase [Acidimicrobiia bacterium]